jgi:hypothetical protein
MKRKINTENFERFFYSTSKVIIYIPIAILVIALLLKFSQSTNILNSNNQAGPSVTPSPQAIYSNKQIDLKGPYKCDYKNDRVDLQAYVKNGKAIATITQKDKSSSKEKYYFDGNCLFVNKVKKSCGLGGNIGIFTGMLGSNSGLFDQLSSQYLKEKVDIKTLLDSCKKEDFKDTVFE